LIYLPPKTIEVSPNARDWYPATEAHRMRVKYAKTAGGDYYRIRRGAYDPSAVGQQYVSVTSRHIEVMAQHEELMNATSKLLPPINPADVVGVVCAREGTNLGEIRSTCRATPVVRARSILSYILHYELGMSYPEISNILRGNTSSHAAAFEAAKRAKRGQYGAMGDIAREVLADARREAVGQ